MTSTDSEDVPELPVQEWDADHELLTSNVFESDDSPSVQELEGDCPDMDLEVLSSHGFSEEDDIETGKVYHSCYPNCSDYIQN